MPELNKELDVLGSCESDESNTSIISHLDNVNHFDDLIHLDDRSDFGYMNCLGDKSVVDDISPSTFDEISRLDDIDHLEDKSQLDGMISNDQVSYDMISHDRFGNYRVECDGEMNSVRLRYYQPSCENENNATNPQSNYTCLM